ncbi:MAG: 16S rRNA (adenine(1518)-N(6)/adenine(1519)-N(6))-dimethyltransferase RsmA [Bacteroidales bacterium]|nr:16S rRNA (adenine(1518)-N(6)/adenine(1519)-N(6))-dimethyltransferase RsmA [Bacteroidales bacterium]
MTYVRPKKSLGQHFLVDRNIASRIVEGLSADYTRNVLEIGPGKGILTTLLLEDSRLNFKAVEIDRESVLFLKTEFQNRLEIIQGDFLKTEPGEIFKDRFNVIGNFPYNISSQIFFKILSYRDLVPEVVCMVQKEVAVRIASAPGNKNYGILSVLLQAFYHIEYLFGVSPKVFNPPPKVQSAVIRLTRNDVKNLECDEALFFQLVKTGFNQRRKMLRNSIKGFLTDSFEDGALLEKRPEQLSVNDFVRLTLLISRQTQ